MAALCGGRRAALAVLVLSLAGCGTRVNADRIEAADGLGGQVALQTAAGGSARGTSTSTGTDPLASTPAAAAGGEPVAATSGSSTTPRAGTGQPAPASGTGGAAAAPVPDGPNAPCKQVLAPVTIGQTSPSSGIIGASVFNMRTGLALWARDVNVRGGIQCHPLRLMQMDDGADPARVISNLNELKNKGAVAIVGAGLPTTFAAGQRFAEQNKIPFVGGDLVEPSWFASPWFFPQGGSPLAAYAGAVQEAAASVQGRKVGLLYCVEAGVCGIINEHFLALAEASGQEVVLRKVTSITAPDYTAECQALKAAGAEAVFFALEGSGDARASRSCVSLGYTPPVATGALSVSAEAALDPNFRKLGVFIGAAVAPFMATDTAGGKEFRAAYDRFAPGSSIDQNTITQWASGKLFEKAIANVFDQARAGPITTALVLDGLWQVKNEKLDGLIPGVSFNKNAPPSASDCFYTLNLSTEGYRAPLGSKVQCFKGLPRGF